MTLCNHILAQNLYSFYKDDVSPSMVDGNGRLKSDTNVISIEGGKYDENK